jgi:SET domain
MTTHHKHPRRGRRQDYVDSDNAEMELNIKSMELVRQRPSNLDATRSRNEERKGQRQTRTSRIDKSRRLGDGKSPAVSSSSRLSLSLKRARTWGIQQQTIQAAGILILAIGTSVWWNRRTGNRTLGNNASDEMVADYPYIESETRSALLSNLVRKICASHEHGGVDGGGSSANGLHHCHKALVAHHTTLTAGKMIRRYETVLSIPRHYTLWDLDALRDPWIQREFVDHSLDSPLEHANTSSTLKTNSLLSLPSTHVAPALLAVYLARLFQLVDNPSLTSIANDDVVPMNSVLRTYMSVLPRRVQDFPFHPLFWSEDYLLGALGKYTSTYAHIRSLQQSVDKEYEVLSRLSPEFARQVNLTQYQVARLNVMTRSFGSGSFPRDQVEVTDKELARYENALGLDLRRGCHVMVPLLDQFNHHAAPNVGFAYQFKKRGFVVTALDTIPKGFEIYDRYGKRTDSDLLAKYGFVNGDGSDYTQASLALWHHVDPEAENKPRSEKDFSMEWKMQMLRYIQYDDGYKACVSKPTLNDDAFGTNAWEFKRLKYHHLLRTGHLSQRWIVRMPPRNTAARPGRSIHAKSHIQTTSSLPAFDMRQLKFDATGVYSTCRLIGSTHNDYGGRSMEMLRANIHNTSFVFPPDHAKRKSALEFRTLFCVARMAQTALNRFNISLPQQLELVATLNSALKRDTATQRKWMIEHVRLGEMQTLEALKQTAYTGLRQYSNEMNSEPAFTMRDEPCPPSVLQPLLDSRLES